MASFSEKYLRCKNPNRFGTSTFRKTFEDSKLTEQAVSIMDRLNWHGVAHLDFVADKNGLFKLIEINPYDIHAYNNLGVLYITAVSI